MPGKMVLSLVGALFALCLFCPQSDGAEAVQKGQIVFSSNRSGSWAIWVMNADGKEMKQLTKPGTGENDVDPMFSPDGKGLLFASTRGSKAGVWKAQADGSKPERLCDGDQAEWSNNGQSIVFRRSERICTRELATGTEAVLTPKDWPHCSAPSWNPDGKTIAFAARWDAGNGVYTVPADGGKPPTKVYDKAGACEPHWSPDGLTLCYETETHICTILPDGTKNRTVTAFGGVQRFPRWSPDGKSLVFCQGANEQGPWEIYTIPAAGGKPVQLTKDGSDMNPHWK